MGPQEPDSLAKVLQLSVEIPHQCYQRPCTAVRGDDRGSIGTPKGIFRVITNRACEEASVQV